MTMKLAEALRVIQSAPAEAAPLDIALICGFTPLHLETFLRAHLCRFFPSRAPRIHAGLFGDLIGNLRRFADASAAAVMIEWPDLDARLGLRRLGGWEPQHFQDIQDEVKRACCLLLEGISRRGKDAPLVVSFPTLPIVPISLSSPSRSDEFTLNLRSQVAQTAAELAGIENVRIINSQWLDAISSGPRLDVKSELSTGFPYSLPHASALGEAFARAILNPLPKKGLITDLDDTLWRGILGEFGMQNISWDLEDSSQIHGLYQQLLRSLAVTGTLVAVASRNDSPLVERAFATRELILRKTDVFPFEVHWGAKSESVARILVAWNIAADDVVCVDDSAMDLSEIKAAHPGIECVLFPRDNPQDAYAMLERLRDLFGKDKITEEDGLRAASLRVNFDLQRRVDQEFPSAAGDFFRHIKGTLTLTSQKRPFDSRAFELVNKTNQFNLNGRRFDEIEWKKWIDRPETFITAVTYRDKYGPLGKIAVIAGDLTDAASSGKRTLYIRTWVMSCRAFARLIEYECLRWLFTKLDIDEMQFDFLANERNAPMEQFLQLICKAPVQQNCRLKREQFLQDCPDSSHVVEEL
jgi:FkbH-like protein